MLPKKGPRAFNILMRALTTTGQHHLAELLDKKLTSEILEEASHPSSSHDKDGFPKTCEAVARRNVVLQDYSE